MPRCTVLFISLAALLLAAACASKQISTPAVSLPSPTRPASTATPTAAPTRTDVPPERLNTPTLLPPTWTLTPTITNTSRPTPTATTMQTPAPTPGTWEIWFEGFFCGNHSSCNIGPGQETFVYSILSDGSNLKQLSITSLPPLPALPAGVTAPGEGNTAIRQFSPDGSSVISVRRKDWGLYSIDLNTGLSTLLYQPRRDFQTDKIFFIAGACWATDGATIRFLIVTNGSEPAVVYQVELDGDNLKELFIVCTKPLPTAVSREKRFDREE